MNAEQIVRAFNARGRHPVWRAKCPVHRSKGLTLALKAGPERLYITCHAGCSSDDVLAAVGLKWQDTLYRDRVRLTPVEYKAMERQRKREAVAERKLRQTVRYWADETRRWETVAGLLFAHLLTRHATPEASTLAKVWERALQTARSRHERLTQFWPKAPIVEVYRLWRVPKEITPQFVGREIAEILGL